jgi:hypothetical protein
MPYVLIGETRAADGPLYVLWTRDASGVRVLSIGSPDRRDVQLVGRRLMEERAGNGDWGVALETDTAAVRRRGDGRPLRLIELSDPERDAIARSIASTLELAEDEGPDRPTG